ncbi:bifunctional 3-demethylubiquinone-9 3-methyltransferase/ 2-octaprenyl-6-hydroxy phenol methylase [Stieleria maiorica]|uniref:Bifunctional 3-demethylubiquinone-9 3-methyltransferase/ 2-octaprenyl-6-hydroxy phenol methylase n=1 Tax=Stieleria maiorica TaxID=2795974 RepID=A0A5B9M655_9BACT|nr:class I SAM-dependent methyltransferase [Stieleria maiorica]QEF96299.1 bifunctional 3-demethylubiquinone-9 3-methyltransferase/ 2-octaprenyl-6-hydroxy phenol methylase [Stieleria maiorica]
MSEARFAFGENWASFLNQLDDQRIDQACRSLAELLCLEDGGDGKPLHGRRFLDLGSGSGLFSLAASRLGADVVSIDFDRQCVACTERLRERDSVPPSRWEIRQGSALDETLMESLGRFDVVYSWGVLHHTGQMQRAIELAAARVADDGRLAIAIYNDQGGASRRWLWIKRTYHRLPKAVRPIWVAAVAAWYEFKFALARLARGRNPLPFSDWKRKRADRGMSAWHDWVDWVGGLPFEVAKPEDVILPLVGRRLQLINLTTVGNGWGCNEFVFRKAG